MRTASASAPRDLTRPEQAAVAEAQLEGASALELDRLEAQHLVPGEAVVARREEAPVGPGRAGRREPGKGAVRASFTDQNTVDYIKK